MHDTAWETTDNNSETHRFAIPFNRPLVLDQTFSVGLKSGEYGGKYTTPAFAPSMAARASVSLWQDKLSMITTSPGRSAGTRHLVTQARKRSAFMAPTNESAAKGPSRRTAVTMVTET
jgi:hypothetical protein